MRLTKFIDHRVQESRHEQKSLGTYSIWIDAETQALGLVLTLARVLLKWIYVPKVVLQYALVQMKVLNEPKPVFENQMAEEKEKKLKKIGMKDKK